MTYRVLVLVQKVGGDGPSDILAQKIVENTDDLKRAMTTAAECIWAVGDREVIRYLDEAGETQEVLP